MNDNITHGLWDVTAKARPSLKTFKGSQTTDVAIVGGGFTGLSAALHLARAKKECVMLEAKHAGFGGSGRNVGLVNAGLWLMPEDVIKLVGPRHGEQLIRILGASPELVYGIIEEYGIDCEAWHYGTLHCADSRAGLKNLEQREAQWQAQGAPVKLLSREEAAKKLGTDVYLGALLDERAGTVQPLSYTYGLANAALKEGAALYEQSPVQGLERQGNLWKLTTPQGTLTAESVILALNGYPEAAFGNQMANMVPFNYFQFATRPLPPKILETVIPGKNGAWDTNLILSSYRLDAQGRLIIGSVGSLEGMAKGINEAWAKRSVKKAFPQIDDVEFEYGWYGRIAMTTNHIPRFHILGDNMAMVTCYNGRGIGPGTVFGKLLAAYMSGGSVADIPLPVSQVRKVPARMVRGLFYEAGSRLYHSVQRRI